MPGHDLVLVTADLGCGGAQRVLTVLANAWASHGLRVCVITFSDQADDFFHLDSRIDRTSIGGLGSSSGSLSAAISANVGRIFKLRRAIREAGTTSVLAFVGVTNILTVLATLGLGLHVVISERNDPARQSLGRPWDILRRLIYPRADVISANSRNAVETLKVIADPDKVVYVENPVPESSAHGYGVKGHVILHVGRLTAQKAQDVLLSAFARIADEAPAWRLSMVGAGELGDVLKQQAVDLGISARVDWFQDVEDMTDIYEGSSIFVLPSRYEGMPNALLEAMSFGAAVVVSDACEGAMDFVSEGESGLIVPVGDDDKLAGALRQLITDPSLRTALGNAARDRVAGRSLGTILEQWNRILKLPGTAGST